MKNITELKDKYKGSDIYVVGSGKSLDFYPLDFFENKLVIGVNRVFKKIKCDYIVIKDFKNLDQYLSQNAPIIMSEYESGLVHPKNSSRSKMHFGFKKVYYFSHLNNDLTKIDKSVFGTDKIIVSYSTITSAMHVAAYLGAKNVILVGHDCGTINGETTFNGYYKDITESAWTDFNQYKKWLSLIESQTVQVKENLKYFYNCNVISLNPFVSLKLEGNKFE
jgi:hypothetical protein